MRTERQVRRRVTLRTLAACLPLWTATGCLERLSRPFASDADADAASLPPDVRTDGDAVVRVGPEARLEFEPGREEPLRVLPGTLVAFVWQSNNHNIVVDEQPAGAEWRGTAGTEPQEGTPELFESGHSHTYRFEVPGTYEYHCTPHERAGGFGTVVVVEEPTER